MTKLIYRAKNIAKAEREAGVKFFEVLERLGDGMAFLDLIFLFEAGGATADDCDEAISKDGIAGAILAVTEGLNESGFLPQKIDTREMREALEEQRKALVKKASAKSGEKTKKTPSKSE